MADHESKENAAGLGRATILFERSAEAVGDAVWHRLRHRPYLGVALTSAAALGLASLVGVSELAVACFAGYAMFKVLRRHEPPSQAFREAAQLEKQLGL
jgi:hypothetical protein